MNGGGRSSDTERLRKLSLSDDESNVDVQLNSATTRRASSPDERPCCSTVSEASTSDSDDSSSSSLGTRAPIELLGEFLLYIRQGNWQDALKLCRMILIYEPDNPEALKFRPLIEEKIKMEAESQSDLETSSEEESETDTSGGETTDGETGSSTGEDDDDEDDEMTRFAHLRNRLVFPVWEDEGDEKKVWKP